MKIIKNIKNKEFIYGLITGIIIIYLLIEIKNNCWIKSSSQKQLEDIINILVRQAARWSTAAKNDMNPLIAVLHANYGAGYLWALKDIATPQQVKSATGIDFLKFEREIVKIQDDSTMTLAKLCPGYAPEKSYLTSIAKEG